MAVICNPIEWSSYDVDAAILADVGELLTKRPEAATCRWELGYEATPARDGKVMTLTVTLDRFIEMPKWRAYDTAEAAEQREWDRFLTALRRHEEGHATIAHRGANSVYASMRGALLVKLARIYERGTRKIQMASDAYDRSTKHGLKQGTTIKIS